MHNDIILSMRVKNILRRFEGNPIISPEDMPFDCCTVMNAVPNADILITVINYEQYEQKKIIA